MSALDCSGRVWSTLGSHQDERSEAAPSSYRGLLCRGPFLGERAFDFLHMESSHLQAQTWYIREKEDKVRELCQQALSESSASTRLAIAAVENWDHDLR